MRNAVIALLTAAVVTGIGVGTAAAQANVYIVHGIPGPAVDVYVDGELLRGGFEPTQIDGPIQLAAGEYQIDIFPAGEEPLAGSELVRASIALSDGQAVALVAHVLAEDEGGQDELAVSAFGVDLRPTLSGAARLGVRHAAVAPPVDLVAASTALLKNGQFTLNVTQRAGAATDAPAGPYTAFLAATGGTERLFPVDGNLSLSLQPGIAYYVYATGKFPDS
ncbi:MAG: DUF4397 domain-containing protein, partial [Acidobacteriota bacterium]